MNQDQQTNPQYVSLPPPQSAMTPLPSPGIPQGQPLSPQVAGQAQVPQPLNAPPLQALPNNPVPTNEYAQAPLSTSVFTDEQWANEARRIITETSNDPFTQTEKLYQLRVQYMQQMHGRELKQGDE